MDTGNGFVYFNEQADENLRVLKSHISQIDEEQYKSIGVIEEESVDEP